MADITATSIINKAFHLTGAFTVEDKLEGPVIAEALDLLNELLASFAVSGLLLPVRNTITFSTSADKSIYTFGSSADYDINTNQLIEITNCNIIEQNGITYPLRSMSSSMYYNSFLNRISYAMPRRYLLEQNPSYSKITFYPSPDRDYTVELQCKQHLSNLTESAKITQINVNYLRFLRYALARELKNYYPASSWNDTKELMYRELEEDVKCSNYTDMTLTCSEDYRGNIYDGF